MVSKLLTILFILPIIYAKIEIDISATDNEERDVRISGSYVDLISETERQTFQLTDENLKKSISEYFGWSPDSVYLKNPTPWGGLFKLLNWEPVKRVFLPKKASIVSVETKPFVAISKDFSNQDSEPKVFKEQIWQTVQTTVSSKWDKETGVNVDDISYHLDMKKPIDSMYFGFSAKMGENIEKTMPIYVKSDLEITLRPKQNAKAQVLFTKETMKIKVDYETSLAGAVAANYDKEYKGHRFWAIDINTVLQAGGLKKEVHSSEIIEVVHYTDAKVWVKDVDTNEVIYSAPLEMH